MLQKLFCSILVVLTSIYMTGCGLSSSSTSTSNSPTGGGGTSPSVSIAGKVTDGPIKSARVALASLKSGLITDYVDSDTNGDFTINVPLAKITNMDEKDLPYIYAHSESEKTEIGTLSLVDNQVQFRSFISANGLKKLAEIAQNTNGNVSVTTDPAAQEEVELKEIAKALTVSHFSNAKAVILETRLKNKYPAKFTEAITPDNYSVNSSATITTGELETAVGQVEAVEADIAQGGEVAHKFMLIAAATKEIVENDNASIIQSPTTTAAVSNSANLLREIAENTIQLNTTFKNSLNAMLTNLQTDLINLEISLGEATKNILDSISAEQIENSTSAQINDISWNIASHFPRRRETWTSGKASAIVSYLPRTGTDELTLEMIPAILAAQATNQTTYEIRYVTKPFSLNLSISFEYSTTNPNHLILKKIDSHNIYLPIGSIAEGREVTSVMSGLNTSCTLEGRTGYITNSRIFTDIKVGNNDNFIHIKVNYDTDKSAELIFGRLRNSLYENVPLGLVAFKGLFGVGDVWYDMEKGHIDGRRYPLEENTAQEVINLLAGKNTNSLDAAHSIATGLLSSSNSSSQQEGRLIWAITNLVKHLDNQASGTTLGGLLNKLNVTDSGRDIFDWTAELTRDISHNGLTLAGLAGLYEIQNYFANSSDSLDNAIIASLTKIEELLYYASALTDTDTIAEIGWYGDFIKFQKKDIYGLKAKMHTLRFLLNFVSAHNLDVANATIDSIVDPKTTANVYDFKTLVERYSRNDMNAEKDSIQDQLEAIDVLKSDANALTLKTGGQTMLNTAKSQLSLACESILKFFTAIESLSGGAKDSAYYMDGEEYESLTNYKKEFLSIWNNLNKTYHTTIGIGESIGNNNWYNLTTPTGKTSFHAIDSTTTTTSNFDYNFIFYGNEEDSFYERQEFTKVDLTQLFNGSLRDSFLGSSNLSSINNDDGLEAYHKDNPNDLIKRFLPDAVLINETEKEYAELRNTLIFSTEKTFVLTMDWSALSSVWSEIEKIWVVTSIEQIASIEKPENAEGNWEYNLSVPDGGARPVRLIIKRNDGENILYSEQSVFWTPWNSYKYVVQSTWFNIENTPISVLKLNYYDSIGGFE